jgi:outer membrane protein OmpA-like peptidoglycan-associated protein
MSTEFTRTSLRLAAAAILAGGLAACSTMESIDPTGLLGDSSSSSDTGGLSDAGAAAGDAAQPDVAEADVAAPDVASVPERPDVPSTPEENAQVAGSLQADAANVQYSAESLRGGTEAAAAPPPPAGTASNVQVAEATPPAQPTAAPPPSEMAAADVPADNITPGTTGAVTEPPAQPDAAPPPPEVAPADTSAPEQPEEAPPPAPADTTSADAQPMTEVPAQPAAAPPPPPAAPVAEVAPAPEAEAVPAPEAVSAPETPAAPEVAAAEAAPEPEAAPAAAPTAPAAPTQVASAGPVPGAQAPVTRRAAPGFAPSKAPPLAPGVSQFVAAPVVARYKQTAMLKPSLYPDYTSTPAYFGPATATVVFPGDRTILDDKGLQQVRAAAELFKAHGGRGYVRIVGYASANSGNLSDARLMHINFDHSQARATVIARALMKEGVPADKVLVSAAPQTATVAKAEIFVQG